MRQRLLLSSPPWRASYCDAPPPLSGLELFCHQVNAEEPHACHVGTRPAEAGNEADRDRLTDLEDDANRRGRRPGGQCRRCAPRRGDHRHLAANQIECQGRQPIVVPVRPTVLDADVLAFDEAGFVQALPTCSGQMQLVQCSIAA